MLDLNYLFKMNNTDLLKMSRTKSLNDTKYNSSERYIVKTDKKEKFQSDLNTVRDDIAFIDELMCDYLESVKDVTKVSKEQVNKFFDRGKVAISKLDTLKNIIFHLNDIFEQEKLYDINGKDLVSFVFTGKKQKILCWKYRTV